MKSNESTRFLLASFGQHPDLERLSKSCAEGFGPLVRLSGWTHAGYVAALLDLEADLVLHIDEDCFIADPDALRRLVDEFRTRGLVAAGVPDGGCIRIREHNPLAINPFFLLLDTQRLRVIRRSDPAIMDSVWEHRFAERTPHVVMTAGVRYQYDNHEPYYPFFYWLHKHDLPVGYLHGETWTEEPEGLTNTVHGFDGGLVAFHTWYSRDYYHHRPQLGVTLRNCAREIKRFLRPPGPGAHHDRINRVYEHIQRVKEPGDAR